MRLGWMEIALIVMLVIVLFGHNKIPGMMKNLADGLKVFKKELKSSPKADVKSEKAVKQKKTVKKTVAKKK